MAALGLTEVKAAREFADAEDIEPACNDRLLDRRGMGELRQADGGAEIGEEGRSASAAAAARRAPAAGWGEALPFRAAHGTEQDGIRGAAGFQRLLRKGVAMGVDGGAADEALGEIERQGRIFRATAASTRRASAMTSGPMPSPARTATLIGLMPLSMRGRKCMKSGNSAGGNGSAPRRRAVACVARVEVARVNSAAWIGKFGLPLGGGAVVHIGMLCLGSRGTPGLG